MFERGGFLAQLSLWLFNRHASVCSGILGGFSIVTMAIYLHRAFHPIQLSNQETTYFNFCCSCMSSVFLYFPPPSIKKIKNKKGVSGPSHHTFLLPGNLCLLLPKAELRGQRVPMKKSRYRNRVGPKSGEAWERCVPLNSFHRATWQSRRTFQRRALTEHQIGSSCILTIGSSRHGATAP